MNPSLTRRLALVALALPLLLLGCDTTEDMFEDDTIFIDREIEFDFGFDADDFDANGTATATGNQSVLISGLLGSGFTADDIVSISGRSGTGELLINFPTDADIDAIDSAELRLGGLLAATAQVTMMDDDEDLTVANTNLTPLADQPGFDGTLQITLADPGAPRNYELEARLELRFEVRP